MRVMSLNRLWILLLAVAASLALSGCNWFDGKKRAAAVPAPSALSYASPQTYTVGTAITALSPTVTGTVTSYGVNPALPAGLSLNTTSGQISGTPTAVATQAAYTVTATNASGSTTFSLSITVNPVAPSGLSYPSPQSLRVGTALVALAPTVTGTVASYAVNPVLPAGLSLNTTSGQITGTPTAVAAQATYTVTATNAGGSTTFALVITVAAAIPAPSGLSYPSPQIFTAGTAIAPLNPTVTGTVTAYSVAPALPAGLMLNTGTGQISGTPTTATASATYTVTAANATGSTTFGLVATVNAAGPASWRTAQALQINTTLLGLDPRIAADANGNAVALWTEVGSGTSVVASVYTPATGWSAPTTLRVGDSTINVRNANVGVGGQGTAFAVWNENVRIAGGAASLQVRVFTPNVGWGAATALDTSSVGTADLTEANVAVNAGGTAVVTWLRSTTTTTTVLARKFTPGGTWGTTTQLDSGLLDPAAPTRLAISDNGDAALVWIRTSAPAGTVAAHMNAGTGWETATLLRAAGADNAGAAIAMDANGNALVGWYQRDTVAATNAFWSARYTAGSGWAAAISVATTANRFLAPPDVAIDATGRNVMVWKDTNVSAATWQTGGAITLAVLETATVSTAPHVASDASGATTAIWELDVAAPLAYKVRSTRFVGGTWGTAVDVQSTTDVNQHDTRLATSANGTAFAVWSQQATASPTVVWANVYR